MLQVVFHPCSGLRYKLRDEIASTNRWLVVFTEFKVARCSRKCFAQGRPLRDGEWFYSVVVEEGEDLSRRDYSAEAWTGPPAGSVGWWKGRMPQAGARKMVLAPDPVLVDVLRGLEDSEARRELRYLLALMLLRRRVVTLVPGADSSKLGGQEPEPKQPDPTMTVRVTADNSEITVAVCAIAQRDVANLETALQELLYCEASDS